MKDTLRKSKFTKANIPSMLMVLPSVICLCVFSVYPLMWMFRYIFSEYTGYKETFTGFANFVRLWNDETFWNSVGTTFEYAGYKLLIVVPITFLLSVLLAQRIRGSEFFRAVYYMPVMISAAVSAMVFSYIFATRNGILNEALDALNIIDDPIKWLNSKEWAMVAVVIYALWGAGTYILYFTSGMSRIDEVLYEAAEIDGANGVQCFFHVTLPMLAPIMKTILMVAVTSAFSDYAAIMVLTGGGPANRTMTMFQYIYRLVFVTDSSSVASIGYGALLSIVASLIVGAVTLVYLRLSKKLDDLV